MYWQGYWGSLVPGALLLIWWSWSLFIRSLLRTLCGFRGKCLSLLMVLLLPARWVDPRTNVWRVYSEILFSCLHSPLMLLEILFRSVGPNLKSNQILHMLALTDSAGTYRQLLTVITVTPTEQTSAAVTCRLKPSEWAEASVLKSEASLQDQTVPVSWQSGGDSPLLGFL